MADSAVPITAGSGTNIDTRTTTTTGDHRQVVVLGDEATDAAVAEVLNASPGSSDYALVVRPIGGAAGTPAGNVLSVQGVASGTTLPVTAAQATPGSLQATVTPIALTKGTQGATGFTVQDLHDAGRVSLHFFTNVAVAGASAETLLGLTGTKNFVTVASTPSPAVVTAGKTLRLTRFAATYVATATSGYGVFKLRVNTAGLVVIGSPVLATIIVGAGTPATANSSNTAQAAIPDGIEIPAGSGIGISAQTFNGTSATSLGLVAASVLGFEY